MIAQTGGEVSMKIAVVTGASSGIGREFALQIPRLYKNLDEIWVMARRTERLEELKKQIYIPVRIFDGDMQRDYIFERLKKELDRRSANIRMLVNAAGYGKVGNDHIKLPGFDKNNSYLLAISGKWK